MKCAAPPSTAEECTERAIIGQRVKNIREEDRKVNAD